jgi:hypothetical protein
LPCTRGISHASPPRPPSFCSVLSRVKDWELGAFTPKTALPDNVDILNPRYRWLCWSVLNLRYRWLCWRVLKLRHRWLCCCALSRPRLRFQATWIFSIPGIDGSVGVCSISGIDGSAGGCSISGIDGSAGRLHAQDELPDKVDILNPRY